MAGVRHHRAEERWLEPDEHELQGLVTGQIGSGYRAAPQVFYFNPQKKWYLVLQTGLPSFSTTDDPTRPGSWPAPRNFQGEMPDIIRDHIGDGYWDDFWVTCDHAKCYLFSSDDNGHLYRSETTVGESPGGFRNTRIALHNDKFGLFEASNVYKVKSKNQYVLLVEAIGSDGRGEQIAQTYRDATDGANSRARRLEQLDLAAHALRIRTGSGAHQPLGRFLLTAAPYALAAAASIAVARLWDTRSAAPAAPAAPAAAPRPSLPRPAVRHVGRPRVCATRLEPYGRRYGSSRVTGRHGSRGRRTGSGVRCRCQFPPVSSQFRRSAVSSRRSAVSGWAGPSPPPRIRRR